MFIKKHPIQLIEIENMVLNFNKVYNRTSMRKSVHRNWLSILTNDSGLKSMFCLIYFAFGTKNNNFSFDEGCPHFNHVYMAIERHENFHVHCNAVLN